MAMNIGVCTKLNSSFWNGIAEQISMEREDLSSQKTGYEQPAAEKSSVIGLFFITLLYCLFVQIKLMQNFVGMCISQIFPLKNSLNR